MMSTRRKVKVKVKVKVKEREREREREREKMGFSWASLCLSRLCFLAGGTRGITGNKLRASGPASVGH